jgi:hypothetical protein
MRGKKSESPCMICRPLEAQDGEYCEKHREELHDLEHRYEGQFRLKRAARGKDHETYDIFMAAECDPCGRVVIQETDPEQLSVTLLISQALKLDAVLPEYDTLGIHKTLGDLLRDRISLELIHSWYGNARACVDIFLTDFATQQHWDVEPRNPEPEDGPETPADPNSPGGGRHSVH